MFKKENTLSTSNKIESNYLCYRVGVNAGAGFKIGQKIDVLGTEGLMSCIAIMITLTNQSNEKCCYLAHVDGALAKNQEGLQEELNKILNDLKVLSGNNDLRWEDFRDSGTYTLTLVGAGEIKIDHLLGMALVDIFYKQYDIDEEDINISLYNKSGKTAFDMQTGKIIIDYQNSLIYGKPTKDNPIASHGEFSSLEVDKENIKINPTPGS